jgi:ubiquinone/menaquinone biosynthesis C-methylase UbiE
MNKDPYRRIAGVYDRMYERIDRDLRVLGFRMFLPPRGGAILDVGCGTGLHLEIYKKSKCNLYGVDNSESMLGVAQARLEKEADLRKADASQLPFETDFFDLVLCMHVLHEMNSDVRSRVLEEIKRVVKPNGRILLIDYHTGKPRPLRGWFYKTIILLSEIAAGGRHFRNYRHFMSTGGLPTLIEKSQLRIDKKRIVGNETMGLYLVRAG